MVIFKLLQILCISITICLDVGTVICGLILLENLFATNSVLEMII
jgi:hypothetical protein